MLTEVAINALKPRDIRYYIGDGHGLWLEVFPTGKMAWRYRYSVNGRREKVVLSGRVDAFAILKEPSAFTTKPKPEKRVEEEAVAEVARANNFPSRQASKSDAAKAQAAPLQNRTQPASWHQTTGETKERFYKAADARNVPLGELLRLALDALDRAGVSN